MPEKVVTAETSNTVKAITFDVGHLYHLNSSDAPGMALVNTVFDGRGYPRWRRSIFLSLSVKRKFGFITGSKNIADSIKYSKTAKVLLDNLEKRFGKSNSAKLYHLQKELSGSVQGSSDVAGYFTKLRRLWDELDALHLTICCSCVCTCEGNKKLTKSFEDQRTIQFLMGLNDVYIQAIGNPLPSMYIVYSLLLQDKNQREVYADAQFSSNSASFTVAGQGNSLMLSF